MLRTPHADCGHGASKSPALPNLQQTCVDSRNDPVRLLVALNAHSRTRGEGAASPSAERDGGSRTKPNHLVSVHYAHQRFPRIIPGYCPIAGRARVGNNARTSDHKNHFQLSTALPPFTSASRIPDPARGLLSARSFGSDRAETGWFPPAQRRHAICRIRPFPPQ